MQKLSHVINSCQLVTLTSQICGDYLLSKMDSQNAISFRNFASSMGDARVLAKVDAFIQDHLLEVSEQEDFLKLPRLKVLNKRIRVLHKGLTVSLELGLLSDREATVQGHWSPVVICSFPSVLLGGLMLNNK